MTPFQFLGAALILWALLSLGTATVGLYLRPNDRWRGFWFMSGLWGLIDGAIAWFGLVTEPPTTQELAFLLKVNGGLDVAYLIVGAALWTRATPLLRGFGQAVVAQGLFLLILDASVFVWCDRLTG
jgi:hypothetical protein